VGHDPDSFAAVGGAHVVSSENSPSRIKPQRGQVFENSVESPRSEHWRVFHERELGSYFTNDPGHFHPEPRALSVKPCALSGAADVLAWESTGHHAHGACPGPAVECAHVIPHWEARQQSVALAGQQHASGVGIKLNSADGAPSKQVPTQDAASCSCK
jgi:hypothetical protein